MRPLVAGHAAVIVFFALSGFVLSLSYWSGREIAYLRYLTRRFFRIYMPYATACLIAVLVARPLLFKALPLSPWFYETWHRALTPKLLASQFLLMGTTADINTAFWSLRYEMELSIVFPFLCGFLRRLRPVGATAFGVACSALGLYIVQHPYSATTTEIGTTLLWGSCFVFGAILAWKHVQISEAYRRLPPLARRSLTCLSLVGFFSYKEQWIIPSACLLIVIVQHGFLKKFMRSAVPEYLGRISYSLYLLHGTVLFATVILMYGRVPTVIVGAVYIVIAFAAAHVMNRTVEEPFDRMGKRLSRIGIGDKESRNVP